MGTEEQGTFVAYSDESNWNTGRYGSIGLITLPQEFAEIVKQRFLADLQSSDVSELKWKHLNGAKQRLAAERFLHNAFNLIDQGRLKIDVIIWDRHDSRHTVQKRDDLANLGRMYYHLLSNVLKRKWPENSIWKLIPDEHTGIDWSKLHEVLNHRGERLEAVGSPLSLASLMEWDTADFAPRLERDFQVAALEQGKSEEEPLLQLADLLAGLVCFSWEAYPRYEVWQSKKLPLLFEAEDQPDCSRRDEARFPILEKFNELSKKRSLQISLKTHRGLRSLGGQKPVNIWLYKPQSAHDKAPTHA